MVKKIELLKKEIEAVKEEHREEFEILRSERVSKISSDPDVDGNPFAGNPFIDMSEYEDRHIVLSGENSTGKVVKFPGSSDNSKAVKKSPLEILTQSISNANAACADAESESKSGYGGVSGYARWARDG